MTATPALYGNSLADKRKVGNGAAISLQLLIFDFESRNMMGLNERRVYSDARRIESREQIWIPRSNIKCKKATQERSDYCLVFITFFFRIEMPATIPVVTGFV